MLIARDRPQDHALANTSRRVDYVVQNECGVGSRRIRYTAEQDQAIQQRRYGSAQDVAVRPEDVHGYDSRQVRSVSADSAAGSGPERRSRTSSRPTIVSFQMPRRYSMFSLMVAIRISSTTDTRSPTV